MSSAGKVTERQIQGALCFPVLKISWIPAASSDVYTVAQVQVPVLLFTQVLESNTIIVL